MKKILFCGGGTGGHIMPNIALIDALEHRAALYYIGAGGMEKELIGRQMAQKVKYFEISAAKFRRSLSLKNLALPFSLAKSVSEARTLLQKIKPDVVFSKGGYAALPVTLAAKKLKIACVGHESDSSAGLAHKLSRGAYKMFFTAYPSAAKGFKGARCIGTPVRHGYKTAYAERGKTIMNFPNKKPVILVMGGSGGAARLNEAVCSAARELGQYNFYFICGKGKLLSRQTLPENARQTEFCSQIFDVYAAAAAAITRGGANSLAELTAIGLPFIAVPLTKASRGEQIKNAEYFSGVLDISQTIFEEQISTKTLGESIDKALSRRDEIVAKMAALNIDATAEIAQTLLEF